FPWQPSSNDLAIRSPQSSSWKRRPASAINAKCGRSIRQRAGRRKARTPPPAAQLPKPQTDRTEPMLNPEIARLIPASLRADVEERVAQLRADPTCFDANLTDAGWIGT